MNLYPHQEDVLEQLKAHNRCAMYLDMGLGKTYTGSEKMMQLGKKVNLVICQKSKVNDWCEHLYTHYHRKYLIFDLTKKNQFADFFNGYEYDRIGVINYELAWRRKDLLKLQDFTLMLDESSLIQNEKAKQTKFILKLQPSNVILLSGTPVSGKYENLVTQANLLGWNISQEIYDRTYVNWTLTEDDGSGMRHRIVDKSDPYKNVDRLKNKLREYGAIFMKTEDVLDLPEQTFIPVMVDAPKEYKKFMKNDIITIDTLNLREFHDGSDFYGKDVTPRVELIGDTIFTKRLYARQLASQYNQNKIDALKDLIQSTQDRLIIFYNFNAELDILKGICGTLQRPYSEVNGSVKDLSNYEEMNDSVTLVQYQSGAKGLNLQKCNKIIYFSLTEKCEDWMQSQKRIHRIGQSQPCFYYILMARNTIDERIYDSLQRGVDFTDDLFY